MASVCANGVKTKRKLLNHIIHKVYGVLLSMTGVYLQCPDSSGIVDGGILEPADLLAICVLEREERDIDLDMMARYLLGIAFGVNGSAADISG